jgi:hypothetical protein
MCDEIERLWGVHQDEKMHKKVNLFTQRKVKQHGNGCIQDRNGNMIMDKTPILERWKQYISELYYDELRVVDPGNEMTERLPLMKGEIEKAIKSLSYNKATGTDDISAAMLKALNDNGIARLTNICNRIYQTGTLPEDILTSIIIPVPKKPMANRCEDNMKTVLMSYVTKILMKVVRERIK